MELFTLTLPVTSYIATPIPILLITTTLSISTFTTFSKYNAARNNITELDELFIVVLFLNCPHPDRVSPLIIILLTLMKPNPVPPSHSTTVTSGPLPVMFVL